MLNKISLIIPTINRIEEIRRLLNSIKECNYKNLEVIIVDQNKEINITPTVDIFKQYFSLKHIKVNFKGAARARNYGLKYASGDIINFPDDDCELSKDLLYKINNMFSEDENHEIIFGKSIDKGTLKPSIVNFSEAALAVNYFNIYKSTVEFTMFIKKNIFQELGGFDEQLGVGTYFGAEEGADLVIRALSKNKKIMYYPELVFYHPEKINKYSIKECIRGLSYARGAGALAYKHICLNRNINVLKLSIYINFKALAAIVIYFLTFKFKKSRFYVYVILGRLQGFLKKSKLA